MHLSSTLEALRKTYSELEGKSEGYLATIRRDKEEYEQMEQLLRAEMVQHVRWSSIAISVPSYQVLGM